MGPRSTIVRVCNLMSAPVDGDLVILNPARGDYVALDEVGRRIWELLETPQRVVDLCRQLGDEFDGEEGQIAVDVVAFLEELRGERLIDVADERPA